MSKILYEVFYIEKCEDRESALVTKENLRVKFKINDATLMRMNTGKPLSIKRHVSLNVAEKYCQALIGAGGTAWLEEMEYGLSRSADRRADKRRLLLDRRNIYRGSALVPDRRDRVGRRSTDK